MCYIGRHACNPACVSISKLTTLVLSLGPNPLMDGKVLKSQSEHGFELPFNSSKRSNNKVTLLSNQNDAEDCVLLLKLKNH